MDRALLFEVALCAALTIFATGCGKKAGAQATSTGPTASSVVPDMNPSHFKVDRPERFPVVTAGEYVAAPELNVTGAVNPDISRQVPVISLTTGRIVEVDARLGDQVAKGQLLFKVRSSDITNAYSNYLQAVKNEELTRVQLDRANLLLEDGAIPKSNQEVAKNAEDNNLIVLKAAKEQLILFQVDPEHPSAVVEIHSPIAGIVTDQQITAEAGVQALNSPAPFTISDLTHLWILCDVYENNLPQVRLGEYADIHVDGYPNRVLKGHISNIGPILDPNLRTAKVRLEVVNPGILRLGMFVNATFHGLHKDAYATVPASAILHLQDREWVYTPASNGYFQRLEVVSGSMLPGNMQQVLSGLKPGTRVISDAFDVQSSVSQ